MIVPGSANPLLLGQSSGYNLTNSLRFRSSASAYLNRTPASASNRKTWTWSAWVKRGVLGVRQGLFSCQNGAGNASLQFGFLDNDCFQMGNGNVYLLQSSALYRDPSAWYHLVVTIDTTLASNRSKVYINGTEITTWATNVFDSNVSQNTDMAINNNLVHYLGQIGASLSYFDGYIGEVNFIDGQALTPSSFGATSTTTGVWQPKKYAGTYGTNGFYLPFTDNSALTTSSNVGLGKDFSGNGNYWTTNNISITSGSTYDSMTDVPTLTSATASNFCTLNPLLKPSVVTLSNANLTSAITGAYNGFANWYINSGKFYWEVKVGNNPSVNGIGISPNPTFTTVFYTETNGVYYYGTGEKYVNGAGSAYGTAPSTNDIVGFALDYNANTLTCYLNNVSQGAITIPSGQTWTPSFGSGNGGVTITNDWNFGQRPFAYTPPTGYVALNTYNLPTPTIGATASTQADNYFDVNLYTGNGGGSNTQTISGLGFAPDFVWLKCRSNAVQSNLFDTVRGATKGLISSSTSGEITDANSLQSFTSDGYVLGPSTISLLPNYPSYTYVGWNWKANGTGSTNTAGSITSTVSANTTAGFSIVTYTGTGSNATVGHGLGVAPKMVIVKNRNDTNVWAVYHASVGAGAFLQLASTAAQTSSSTVWNSTAPTSTVFSIGTNGATNQSSGQTYVAYCFSEVAGYSKFGSYTGNGSADGVFNYTGFKPRYIMIKGTSNLREWFLIDTARNQYNVADLYLRANTSAAEGTATMTDIVSNGFKLRSSDTAFNGSGETYIYMAFAENPFKFSLAR